MGLGAAPAQTAQEIPDSGGTPTAVIESFHGALLSVMKDAGKLGVDGRYQRLAAPLSASYDFSVMTRISSGAYWRRASEVEQTELVAAFRRVSIGTYAVRFDGFSGQAFEIMGEKAGPRGTILVDTQIISPGDDPIDITYVMKNGRDKWRIVDVLLSGGVSELAVRRSEYRSVLKNQGVNGLIQVLNTKADDLIGQAG